MGWSCREGVGEKLTDKEENREKECLPDSKPTEQM